MMDKGTGMGTGSEKVIGTHTHGTCIHVPGRFTVPMSNTTHCFVPLVLHRRLSHLTSCGRFLMKVVIFI